MAINDIYRGDTKRYKFSFADAQAAVIDITSWEIWFTAKNDKADADVDAVIQVKKTAGGDPADDPVNGVMYVELDSSDTNVDPSTLFYDFQRVIPGSPPNVRTLDADKVKILEDITRSNT